MLTVGAIVEYQEKRWFVSHRDPDMRYVTLTPLQGSPVSVEEELDARDPSCKVVAIPGQEWQVLNLPPTKNGKIVEIRLPRGTRMYNLALMEDWWPSDANRGGGSTFFNPVLRLKYGETMNIVYANGKMARVTVPKTTGTVAERIQRAAAKPAEEEQEDFIGDLREG